MYSSGSIDSGKQPVTQEQIAQLQPYSGFKILQAYKWRSHMQGAKGVLYHLSIFDKNGSHHDVIF